MEDGSYNFTIQDLKDLRNKTEFPVVVNWAFENKTCSEAMLDTSSYACKENNDCYDSESGNIIIISEWYYYISEWCVIIL